MGQVILKDFSCPEKEVMYMRFKDMRISEKTKKALKLQGFHEPTEVQEKAIPIGIEGKDLIVQSKTGSGKTLAFLISIFENVGKGLEAIVLVPTRELAQQVEKVARMLGKSHAKSTVAIYGGVSMENQIRDLKYASIVVGTPGRIMDLMRRGYLNLDRIKFFVLDEADRMLDMGFIDDIKWILQRTPEEKQIMLFSATMPQEIVNLARRYMRDPVKIYLSKDELTADNIAQYYVEVGEVNKIAKLSSLIIQERGKYLVFCNTRRKTKSVAEILQKYGFRAYALHGDMRQAARTKTMNAYKDGKIDILISTDVAARGIDVHGITHVVNYDVPLYPKDYVHRIGRTGRMDAHGKAITFVSREEMEYFRRIEDYLGKRIQKIEIKNAGKIKERIDYREHSDIFGFVKFRFELRNELSEWDIVKIADNAGISEDSIGDIYLQGKRGEIKVHYRSAPKLKRIRIFKELRLESAR